MIGIANVDRSSQVFALFEELPVQKDPVQIYHVGDSRP